MIVPAFFDSISITSVIGSLTIRNFKVTHTHEIYEKTRKGISSQIIRTDFRDLSVNFVGLVELLTKNSMDYIPNTDRDNEIMLKEMGISSFESLLEDIPKSLRNFSLPLPYGLSEPQVLKTLKDLSDKNISTGNCISFLGAGAYEHYIPTVVDHLAYFRLVGGVAGIKFAPRCQMVYNRRDIMFISAGA